MKKYFILPVSVLFYATFALSAIPAHAQKKQEEKILSFKTELQVKTDLSVLATETVKVRSQRKAINRGISREFPKQYRDSKGNQRKFDFKIIAIFRDDIPERFFTRDLGAGTQILIGKTDYILPPGVYTYTIIYEVPNAVTEKDDSYEVYWDVTGKRWAFPIESASIAVKLPYGSYERVLEKEAFISDKPAGENKVLFAKDAFGNPLFASKIEIGLRQRFAVFVSWLKKPPPEELKEKSQKEMEKHLATLKHEPTPEPKQFLSSSPNELSVGPYAKVKSIINITLNDPVELDYKTRNEIIEQRAEYVNQHKELLKNKYLGFSPVFRSIISKQPWWGTKGAFCYGPGEASIKGPSETARFLANPFLLLGVDDSLPADSKKRSYFPVFIKPSSLTWDSQNAQAVVVYEMSDFLKDWKRMPYDLRRIPFTLINYNARDFGYRYVYSPKDDCRNITPAEDSELFKKATLLRNFLLLDYTCNYVRGCNGVGPTQPELYFSVQPHLPALLTCKLWKKEPKSVNDNADFIFIIKFQ